MSKPDKVVPEKAIGNKGEPSQKTINERDSIIYALGIGFSQDPLKQEDYRYTIETQENFAVFPTYLTCVCNVDLFSLLLNSGGLPEFNPFMLLHAEERIELFKPLETGVQYTNNGYISDVADKGKIGLVTIQKECKDNKGQLIGTVQTSLAIKGLGGFGYKGNGSTGKIPERPKRNPDVTLEANSYPGQAFLYRQSGDLNPLHVKPQISAIQKFDRPIIHGLASFGIVARVLIQKLLKNDPNNLKIYHARFVGHVYPGESYKISVWKEKGYLWFSAQVTERGKECLFGYLTVREQAKL